jgi:hypothetical protein
VAIRFTPETGEAWASLPGGKWGKIEDPEKIPAGDYDIVFSGPQKDADPAVFRIDHIVGTTWFLGGRKWVKIEEPMK